MTDIRIRGIDVCSHKLDDKEPPNYGTMTVEIGGTEMKIYLKQDQVDELVASALPIAMSTVREIASYRGSSRA